MTSIAQKLSEIVGAAFEAADLPADLGRVSVSDRPDLAQFQCNGAMAAAKIAKVNPREIAQKIVDTLESSPPNPPAGGGEAQSAGGESIFSKIDIAGPGFINLNVTDAYLQDHLQSIAGDDRLGVPKTADGETIIIDYGGYTIAKPLHVGHLRSTIIGNSIKRILSFAGYKALGDVHLADWGTQMGMIIDALSRKYPEWSYFDPDFNGSYPQDPPVTLEEYAQIYPAASKACKEDEALMESARKATAELQDGRRGYRALWRHMLSVSIEGIKERLQKLDVDYELWKSEGDVHDLIAPMVGDLREKGVAQESDGAWIVPVAEEGDKKEMPPLILYKRDGAVMYGTTDMATLVERMKLYNPAKVIYVVDQRQALHFEQVFRAVRKGGIVPEEVELTHAGFGTMNGTDGKPFKTREGGVMRLEDLIDMAEGKAKERLAEAHLAEDMDAAEKEDVAHKVGLAAIKFADLQNQRHADYVFDLDRLTSFEGKTGPYLLYQAVRIKSLLRKAEEQMNGETEKQNDPFLRSLVSLFLQDEDRPLALLLTELPDYIEGALRNYAPHHLCEYAYKLAQTFSGFYNAVHILSEEDEALKHSRLALCALTYKQLELVLDMLGIKIPQRM